VQGLLLELDRQKKNLNLKLFGTCNLGGMTKTKIKQLNSNLKQHNQFRIKNEK
jgi:hypothetical protein